MTSQEYVAARAGSTFTLIDSLIKYTEWCSLINLINDSAWQLYN